MKLKFVGLDVCPYCGGTDVVIDENRPEIEADGRGEALPDDMVCQDVDCENCGRAWTVEYRPVAYYLYRGETGEFDPTRHAFAPEAP